MLCGQEVGERESMWRERLAGKLQRTCRAGPEWGGHTWWKQNSELRMRSEGISALKNCSRELEPQQSFNVTREHGITLVL